MVKEDIFMQIGCLYRKFCEWSGTEGSYDWMDMIIDNGYGEEFWKNK